MADDADLDMRMDKTSKLTAKYIINEYGRNVTKKSFTILFTRQK